MTKAGVVAAAVVLGASGVLILHTLLDPDGWSRREKVRVDLASIQKENTRLEEKVARLRREIEALRTRVAVQEQTVRDELGFVKPGEMVLDITPQKSPRDDHP